jgi:hypothetical protein
MKGFAVVMGTSEVYQSRRTVPETGGDKRLAGALLKGLHKKPF